MIFINRTKSYFISRERKILAVIYFLGSLCFVLLQNISEQCVAYVITPEIIRDSSDESDRINNSTLQSISISNQTEPDLFADFKVMQQSRFLQNIKKCSYENQNK